MFIIDRCNSMILIEPVFNTIYNEKFSILRIKKLCYGFFNDT